MGPDSSLYPEALDNNGFASSTKDEAWIVLSMDDVQYHCSHQFIPPITRMKCLK